MNSASLMKWLLAHIEFDGFVFLLKNGSLGSRTAVVSSINLSCFSFLKDEFLLTFFHAILEILRTKTFSQTKKAHSGAMHFPSPNSNLYGKNIKRIRDQRRNQLHAKEEEKGRKTFTLFFKFSSSWSVNPMKRICTNKGAICDLKHIKVLRAKSSDLHRRSRPKKIMLKYNRWIGGLTLQDP